MKITLFLTTVCMLLCCSGTNPSKRSNEDVAPQRIPLADPYILLHEGIYYAYGTFAENGIAAWTSTDLKSWKRAKGLAPEDLVMHRRDVWGNTGFGPPKSITATENSISTIRQKNTSARLSLIHRSARLGKR